MDVCRVTGCPFGPVSGLILNSYCLLMLEGGGGLPRRWRWAMTWATTVGVDSGRRRAMRWVAMWAMTWATRMAGLTGDDSGVDGGWWKKGALMMLFCVVLGRISSTKIVGEEIMPLLDSSHHFCHGVDCKYCRNCQSIHSRLKTLRYEIAIFCTNIPGRPRRN